MCNQGLGGNTVPNGPELCQYGTDLHLVRIGRDISLDSRFIDGLLVVQEHRYTEDDGGPPREDQGPSNTETSQSGDGENVDDSTTLTTAKRRGWGHALLGAVQNAVPKRHKEQKKIHFTFPHKSISLPPLRLGRRPPGLKKRGSWESAKW